VIKYVQIKLCIWSEQKKMVNFLPFLPWKTPLFHQHVKKLYKQFSCLGEHIVSVNNDTVGEYYEKLCMTFLYNNNRVNPQILAAILDFELLLK